MNILVEHSWFEGFSDLHKIIRDYPGYEIEHGYMKDRVASPEQREVIFAAMKEFVAASCGRQCKRADRIRAAKIEDVADWYNVTNRLKWDHGLVYYVADQYYPWEMARLRDAFDPESCKREKRRNVR